MAKRKSKANPSPPAPLELPAGVKLLRTLRGHTGPIGRIAWSPDGRMLASPSLDKTIRLWDAETGECLRTIQGHKGIDLAVAFDPAGSTLAGASIDSTVKLWESISGRLLRTLAGYKDMAWSVAFDKAGHTLASSASKGSVNLWKVSSGRLLRVLEGHQVEVYGVAFDPAGRTLASGGADKTIKLWDTTDGRLLRTLEVNAQVSSVAFDPQGHILASVGWDGAVRLWDADSGQLMRSLEGHTSLVKWVGYSSVHRLLATKGHQGDDTIRVWAADGRACIAVIPEPASSWLPAGLDFHPKLPLLATVGSDPGTPAKTKLEGDHLRDRVSHIWELDPAVLLGQAAAPAVTYTSAKIVLVGDSGVGKTGLGWLLAHGTFQEHASTHGQQFWLLDQSVRRELTARSVRPSCGTSRGSRITA